MTRSKANKILEKQMKKLNEEIETVKGDTLAAVSRAICETYSVMHNVRAFDEEEMGEFKGPAS